MTLFPESCPFPGNRFGSSPESLRVSAAGQANSGKAQALWPAPQENGWSHTPQRRGGCGDKGFS